MIWGGEMECNKEKHYGNYHSTHEEAEAGYIEPSNVGAEFGWKDLEKIENAFRYWGVELERQQQSKKLLF